MTHATLDSDGRKQALQALIELGRFDVSDLDDIIENACRVPYTEQGKVIKIILSRQPDFSQLKKMWGACWWGDNQEDIFRCLCAAAADLEALFELWPLMGDSRYSIWPLNLAQQIVQHAECGLEATLRLYRLIHGESHLPKSHELVGLVDNAVKKLLQQQATELLLRYLHDRTQLQPVTMLIEILAMRQYDLEKLQVDAALRANARAALALTGRIAPEEFSTEELLRIRHTEAPVQTLTAWAVCLAERADCSLRQFLPVLRFNGIESSLFFRLLKRKCARALPDDMLNALELLVSDISSHENLVQPVTDNMIGREDLNIHQVFRLAHHYLDVHNFGECELTRRVKDRLRSRLMTLPWALLLQYAEDTQSSVGAVVQDVMVARVPELSTEEILALYRQSHSQLRIAARSCLESRVYDLFRMAR